MTRKDLSKLYYLNKEIEMWHTELEKLEARSGYETAPVSDTPKPFRKQSSPTEQRMLSVARCKTKIDVLMLKAQKAQEETLSFIETIDDPLMRQIVMHRCVHLYGWKKIATLMGGLSSPESLRNSYSQYLKKMFKEH